MGRHISIASDDADKGSSGDTGADKDLMDALTYNASSLSVRVFEAHYEGINRCNQALNIVPQLDKATPALRTRLVGEAKIFKSLYVYLVKTFGGVPILIIYQTHLLMMIESCS
jgi:hypothetical protein